MIDRIEKGKTEDVPNLDHISPLVHDSRPFDKPSNANEPTPKQDTASSHLPDLKVNDSNNKETNLRTAVPESTHGVMSRFMPEEVLEPQQGQTVGVNEKELAGPFGDKTQKVLMKDADQFPPVHNSDGSTTYTVLQAGITDRPGRDNGIDYFSRTVDVTVPKKDNPSLNDCKYVFNQRETISKQDFDKLIDRNKASNPEMEFYSHGVGSTADGADQQAFLLQLSTGRPSINLDWNTVPHDDSVTGMAKGYWNDVTAAKRSNDNKAFQQAIDGAIQEIGADHTSMVGFSHGALFDARYLAHRAASNLPKLENLVLTHPDVPLGAPELQVKGEPELLKDVAEHSFVIGGKIDLDMKIASPASIPGYPAFEWGGSEERLGDDRDSTRDLISKEGGVAISERDRHELSMQHFLNYAGVAQLLNQGTSLGDKEQSAYDAATDYGRQDHGDSGGWSGRVSDLLHKAESVREAIHLPSWLSF